MCRRFGATERRITRNRMVSKEQENFTSDISPLTNLSTLNNFKSHIRMSRIV